MIPQGKHQLCNPAPRLPHAEHYNSDTVNPVPLLAGKALMGEGGLKGRQQDPEAPCKAHVDNVLSQELCQETSNHLLVQSKPNPTPFLILEAPCGKRKSRVL